MHAHDRTLLAKLGFADPDRGNPLHDLACRYLTQPEVHERVCHVLNLVDPVKCEPLVWFSPPDDADGQSGQRSQYCCCKGQQACDHCGVRQQALVKATNYVDLRASMEVPLTKGSGQYATTIGFLDVVLTQCAELSVHALEVPTRDYSVDRCPAIVIEVKTADPGVGSVLRQLKLYREYVHTYSFPSKGDIIYVLASLYQPSKEDLLALEGEGIRHLRLGDTFKRYADNPSTPGSSVEV